jgi:hypothetical protein
LGFYRLLFTLGVDIHPFSEGIQYRLTGFAGDLFVQGRLLGSFAVSQQSFPLEPQAGYVSPRSLNFFIDLDRARLEALEEIRAGAGLQLMMQYYATFAPNEGHLSTHTGQSGISISQSDWISVLAELEYARTLLLELPVADARLDPELAGASNFLSQAQQTMARGEYREAVGLCRDVLDEIDKGLPRGSEAEFTNLRALDKSQRLALVRRALKVFTHPARHRDDVAARFEWSRRDALFCVTCVSALLNELNAPDALPATTPVSALTPEPPSPDEVPETIPNSVES